VAQAVHRRGARVRRNRRRPRNRLQELFERPIFCFRAGDRLRPQGVVMSNHVVRWRAFWLGLCAIPLLIAEAPVAVAAKIKMAFPGPVTTFSLPYLVPPT